MRDQARLQDILESIETIESYAVSSYEEFLADTKTQQAILYNLMIIGEAANRISEDLREEYPAIPWSSMIGTRNIIIHGYDQVKLPIIWEIIRQDLSKLKSEIIKAINPSSG